MDQSARTLLHRCKRRQRQGGQLEPGTCQPECPGAEWLVEAFPQGGRPGQRDRVKGQRQLERGPCQYDHISRRTPVVFRIWPWELTLACGRIEYEASSLVRRSNGGDVVGGGFASGSNASSRARPEQH